MAPKLQGRWLHEAKEGCRSGEVTYVNGEHAVVKRTCITFIHLKSSYRRKQQTRTGQANRYELEGKEIRTGLDTEKEEELHNDT